MIMTRKIYHIVGIPVDIKHTSARHPCWKSTEQGKSQTENLQNYTHNWRSSKTWKWVLISIGSTYNILHTEFFFNTTMMPPYVNVSELTQVKVFPTAW